MRHTFGKHLKNFALTTDIINNEIFISVRKIIEEYTANVLAIDVTHLLLDADIEGGDTIQKGLIPFILTRKREYKTVSSLNPEKWDKDQPSSQSAYCYINQKPLWIVSKDPNTDLLRKARMWKNLWNPERENEPLPPYRAPAGEKVDLPLKTSILIPLPKVGVLNFETHDHLEPTPTAQAELYLLADTLGILYQKLRTYESTISNTWEAVDNFQRQLKQQHPKLTRPRIFLASSSKADTAIIKTIRELLESDKYKLKLRLRFWEDMHESGNISLQLLHELSSCRYGICYFSELAPESTSPHYRDNMNVIFEAGMLHGRTDADPAFPAEWIPIREKDSPPAPFDFSTERIILVPRIAETNELDEQKFRGLLEQRLNFLLEGDTDNPYL